MLFAALTMCRQLNFYSQLWSVWKYSTEVVVGKGLIALCVG